MSDKTQTPETDKARLSPHETSRTTMVLVSAHFAERLERERDEYRQGHLRYEAMRQLNLKQLGDIHAKHLHGANFDAMIDELVLGKLNLASDEKLE